MKPVSVVVETIRTCQRHNSFHVYVAVCRPKTIFDNREADGLIQSIAVFCISTLFHMASMKDNILLIYYGIFTIFLHMLYYLRKKKCFNYIFAIIYKICLRVKISKLL